MFKKHRLLFAMCVTTIIGLSVAAIYASYAYDKKNIIVDCENATFSPGNNTLCCERENEKIRPCADIFILTTMLVMTLCGAILTTMTVFKCCCRYRRYNESDC